MHFSSDDLLSCALRYAAEERLAREGVETRLYFDTGDLRDAIVGLYAYWNPGGLLDEDKLLSDHSMVWVLYAGGFLGPVRLSTPHQAELLTQLQGGFHVHYTPAEEAAHRRDFPHVVSPLLVRTGVASLPQELEFKISEALRRSWRSRLTELIDSSRLDMSPSEVNYEEAINTKEFRDLNAAFGRIRKQRSVNNFTDAAALYTFLCDVRTWHNDHTAPLPQFFATSRYFEDALREAKLRDQFQIIVGEKENAIKLDLIPTAKQLVFRALRKVADKNHPLYGALADLDAALTSGPIDIQYRILQLNGHLLESLSQAMHELFLQTQAASLSKDEGNIREDHRRLQKLAVDLQTQTSAFRDLRDIWIRSRNALRSEDHADWRARLDQQHNPLFVGGLLRFSFPEESLARLESTIENVVNSDDEIGSALARTFVRASPKTDKTELACAVAALWLLKLDDRILDVIRRAAPKHFSFRIIEGAAVFRIWESAGAHRTDPKVLRHKLQDIVERLTQDHAKVPRNGEAQSDAGMRSRAQTAIGLAYLNYRVAIMAGFRPSWNRQGEPPVVDERVERAVLLAGTAASDHHLSDAQRAYAANQYLYYMIAAGTADDLTLQGAFPLLSNVARTPRVWQPRFDDTLARYFFVRATRKTDPGEKATYLNWSYGASELALRGDPKESEVIAFNLQIKGECDRAGVVPKTQSTAAM